MCYPGCLGGLVSCVVAVEAGETACPRAWPWTPHEVADTSTGHALKLEIKTTT